MFILSLLDTTHKKESAKKKQESSLDVSLSKATNGTPAALEGRQVVGPSYQPVAVISSNPALFKLFTHTL